MRADYVALDEATADDEAFADGPVELVRAAPAVRREALLYVLEAMRKALAVQVEALEPTAMDALSNRSRGALREPWAFSSQETPRSAAALMIEAPTKKQISLRSEPLLTSR